jgi:hypothetical protein
LVQVDPDDRTWQHDLAVILNETGDVLVTRDKVPQGLQFYRDGLAIIERLLQAEPDNVQWQQDALWSNWRLATYDDDALRRWQFIVTTLHVLASRNALTDEQTKWLPTAERQLKKLTPR